MADATPAHRHEALAQAWIEAWNAHDLDAILAHYADDAELISPLVVERLGRSDGTVRGKAELRAYFARGLASATELRFAYVAVLDSVGAFTLLYQGRHGRLVAETVTLDAAGRISRALVAYAPPGVAL